MERTGERVTYRCRLCRQQLFDSSCVLNTSTYHHQDAVSTVPECLLGQSAAASPTWSLAGSMQGSAKSFNALLTQGKTGGSSNGVLAPYGPVLAGPNPLWFIKEDSTPPWVQRTLDKVCNYLFHHSHFIFIHVNNSISFELLTFELFRLVFVSATHIFLVLLRLKIYFRCAVKTTMSHLRAKK